MALTRPRYSQIYDSDFKNSARVATGSSVTLAGAAPKVVDDVTLVANDRILVRAQNTPSQNGIYIVSVLGTGANGTWTRSLDADTSSKLSPGTTLTIEEGTVYGSKQYRMTSPGPITLGVSDIAWTDVSGGGGSVPGGTSGQFQYNSNNNLLGSTYLYYNPSTGQVTANSTASSTSTTTGALVVTGGLGVSGAIYAGSLQQTPIGSTTASTGAFTTLTTGGLQAGAIGNVTPGTGAFTTLSATSTSIVGGNLVAGATTTSTSTTTGALVVAGGAGIAGHLYVGGNLTVTGNTVFQNSVIETTTEIVQGISIVSGNLVANSGTSSTSTTTGALVVIGGAGITGRLNVGANLTVTGNALPSTNTTYNLGSPDQKWKNLYLGGDTFDLGGGSVVSADGVFILKNNQGGSFNLTGTVTGRGTGTFGNLIANSTMASTSTSTGALQVIGGAGISGATYIGGVLNAAGATTLQSTLAVTSTSNFSGATNHANGITASTVSAGTIGNTGATLTGTLSTAAQTNVTSVGTLTGLTVGGTILPNANLTINVGSTSAWFNTFYGVSTQAKYADLAENYLADAAYPPGTVVVFGGEKEVTTTTTSHDTAVAGVVSTNPAHLMNGLLQGDTVVAVGLTGRLPCRVQGPVKKGDVLVTGVTPGVAQRIGYNYQPGCVIGKALETINTNMIETIEVVVGRF